jgi:hypothetical protein
MSQAGRGTILRAALFALTGASFLPSSALSQESAPAAADASANAADLGPRHFIGNIGIADEYSNNIYYERTDKNSAFSTSVHPELGYIGDAGWMQLKALANATYAIVKVRDSKGDNDNYLDGGFRTNFDWNPTVANRFEMFGAYNHGHDPFGLDRTETVAAHDRDLDVWNLAEGTFHYRFGAPTATLNAQVGVAALTKDYITNRRDTRFLNYDTTTYDYTLFYNLSPKTAMLMDYSRTQVLFDTPYPTGESGDGHEYRTHAGFRWQATGKTSGDARFGYLRRDFDDGVTPTLAAFDWLVGASWNATAKSLLELHTGRSMQQSYRIDTRVMNTRGVTLDFTENWTARLKSKLSVGRTDQEFIGTSGRNDRITNAALETGYVVDDLLLIYAKVDYTDRNSTDTLIEYNRADFLLGIRLGR